LTETPYGSFCLFLVLALIEISYETSYGIFVLVFVLAFIYMGARRYIWNFSLYLCISIFKNYFFLIGPVSRAARWQLKASGPPGLQVESYLLQQDLAAGAKIKS